MRTVAERGLGFEQFKPVYNRYIQGWLKQQKADAEEAIAAALKELAEVSDPGIEAVTGRMPWTRWKAESGDRFSPRSGRLFC